MHITIFAISFTLFLTSVIMLSIESNKLENERETTYIYLSLLFAFVGFIVMALYCIIFLLEYLKLN